MVRRLRRSASSCTTGATPCAEKTTMAPSGTSSVSSTKMAPRSSRVRTTCELCTICLRTEIGAHTPIGRFLPQPLLDDNAAAEGERIAADARETTIRVATPPEPAVKPVKDRPGPVRDRAPEPAAEARDAGAPGVVTEEVDK